MWKKKSARWSGGLHGIEIGQKKTKGEEFACHRYTLNPGTDGINNE
jgi:hypothetical protein